MGMEYDQRYEIPIDRAGHFVSKNFAVKTLILFHKLHQIDILDSILLCSILYPHSFKTPVIAAQIEKNSFCAAITTHFPYCKSCLSQSLSGSLRLFSLLICHLYVLHQFFQCLAFFLPQRVSLLGVAQGDDQAHRVLQIGKSLELFAVQPAEDAGCEP